MNWEKVYKKIETKLVAECIRNRGKIPYIVKNGAYNDMLEENPSWWTNGFWAGLLWQMYHAGNNPLFRETAEQSEAVMDQILESFMGLHHDVGFQFLLTSAANYRLTGNERARVRALHAATILAGRFNPNGGFIRAWNAKNGNDMTGWIIIDCLMNLPLLHFAESELHDPRFTDIANRHADTAMRVLQRPDGSCDHIAILNPVTGEVLEKPAGQGYAQGSSWSRGQAWAIYGFALAFAHTGNTAYLDAAKRTAHYFIANVTLSGKISFSDFRAPKEPVYWDMSAAACAVCGLLELADIVPELEKPLYYEHAVQILEVLTDYCDFDPQTDGILQKCTASYGRSEDMHASIIYGDYFYTEAVLRLLKKSFLIW